MSEREFSSGSGFAASAGTAVLRGGMLIAAAILLGFLLLSQADGGDDLSAPQVAGSDSTSDVASSTVVADTLPQDPSATTPAGGVESSVTTTTAIAGTVDPPQEVKVLVANAAGVALVAGQETDQIATGGYNTLPATDASQSLEDSFIAYREGYGDEAAALAEFIDLEVDEDRLRPLAEVSVSTGSAQQDEADLIVFLAPDLVGG